MCTFVLAFLSFFFPYFHFGLIHRLKHAEEVAADCLLQYSSLLVKLCNRITASIARALRWTVRACRVVETSSYAVDRDSDSSSEVQPATNAGALTNQGSRELRSVRPSAKDFFLKQRTFKGVQTPATGAPLKAASQVAPGLTGRAAVYSQEAH
jgi:hypothetical protein